MNMKKEQILKEFKQRFSSRSTIDLNLFPDVTEFISKAIDQTREETIKEIGELSKVFPIDKVLTILNKLKN